MRRNNERWHGVVVEKVARLPTREKPSRVRRKERRKAERERGLPEGSWGAMWESIRKEDGHD